MSNPGCLLGWLANLNNAPRGTQPKTTPNYQRVDSLLTPAERSFYHVLTKCVPTGWTIAIKARLADLLKPRDKHGSKEYWTAGCPSLTRRAKAVDVRRLQASGQPFM